MLLFAVDKIWAHDADLVSASEPAAFADVGSILLPHVTMSTRFCWLAASAVGLLRQHQQRLGAMQTTKQRCTSSRSGSRRVPRVACNQALHALVHY
jgi:hypothetical protein